MQNIIKIIKYIVIISVIILIYIIANKYISFKIYELEREVELKRLTIVNDSIYKANILLKVKSEEKDKEIIIKKEKIKIIENKINEIETKIDSLGITESDSLILNIINE